MRVKTTTSYNLDLLCFMNVMTANPTFVDCHKESFELFYPKISKKLKKRVNFLNKMNLAGLFGTVCTSLISCLDGFQDKDLLELLGRKSEIKKLHSKSTNPFPPFLYFMSFRLINRMAIPLAKELEAAGFREFWHEHRQPLLQDKLAEYDEYFADCRVADAVSQYKKVDKSDFTIYLCSFSKPLCVKLCGNNMIYDFFYDTGDTGLIFLAHEMLHPMVRHSAVKQHVKALGKKGWVKEGYSKQGWGMSYKPMEMYIEENIVSAMGYHIAQQLGAKTDVNAELAERADSSGLSQVLAPHFYDYLCEFPKKPSQPFDDYFIAFVNDLDRKIR